MRPSRGKPPSRARRAVAPARLEFDAVLEASGPGGRFVFVVVPSDGSRRGTFGVRATVDGVSFDAEVVPDRQGRPCLGVPREWCERSGKKAGDAAHVVLDPRAPGAVT